MEQVMIMRYQQVLRSAARLAEASVPRCFGQRTRLRARTGRASAFRAALSGADSLASSFSRVGGA
jgi:hypothetical protein